MPPAQAQPPPSRAAAPTSVLFEYLGRTGLSVIGPITRRLYRFDAAHSRVLVDPRDAPAIARVPHVKQTR